VKLDHIYAAILQEYFTKLKEKPNTKRLWEQLWEKVADDLVWAAESM